MRLNTIAVALLVAATTYAQTEGRTRPSSASTVREVLSRPLNFVPEADRIGTFEPVEKKCICTEVASNKWVNACRAICPVEWTDLMYSRFEIAKTQCVGVSTQPTQPESASSAALSLASGAGAALFIAAAVVQAFF
ncbi:hypothetical protein BGZ67_004101 [Mortierella alpina]|nr:hypothetical protein BGZ67_004101 [Mortierella alpina]